eukprot:636364-Prymnesium_polylepis.2
MHACSVAAYAESPARAKWCRSQQQQRRPAAACASPRGAAPLTLWTPTRIRCQQSPTLEPDRIDHGCSSTWNVLSVRPVAIAASAAADRPPAFKRPSSSKARRRFSLGSFV